MREISVEQITDIVKKLSIEANIISNKDLKDRLYESIQEEKSPIGKSILEQLLKNQEIAEEEKIPICQDTGFTVVFLDIGQEVILKGGDLEEAVNEGIRQGYTDGYLRKSIIKNPITHPVNTKDNTPAIIHTKIVPGDRIKVTVLPKGGGAENMSRIKMLKPADGIKGIKSFVLKTVKAAGANACPPVIVGVGVGGTFDYVAYLAKKAILRAIGERNADPLIAEHEREWLYEINKLGIGPAGFGGTVTALDVFIEVFPRHIATLPAAVNIQCNAARSKSYII